MQLLPGINKIIQAIANIKYGFPSLEKIYSEKKKSIDAKEQNKELATKNSSIKFQKSIFLNNIVFSYGKKKIIEGLSIKIKKGEKIAFVGESGAGKTTILDIILGLQQPDSGDIYIDDTKITSGNLSAWQDFIGYIPQMIYLCDSDIRQNIAFGIPNNEIDDKQVDACLELASLSTFVNSLPNNIYSLIGENGIQLSGGQRQRIGIARAMYRNPLVLVMDEATAALDNQTEHEVTQALSIATQGRTIITVAHRISTIMDYDTICFFKEGNIIAQGTYKELLASSEEFKRFVIFNKNIKT